MQAAVSTEERKSPDLSAFYQPIGIRALVAATLMQRQDSQANTLTDVGLPSNTPLPVERADRRR